MLKMKVRKVVDLSITIMEGMTIFPGDIIPEITQVSDFNEKGYRLSRITLGSHTGTHIDAPSHMIEGGATINKISLDSLMGEATIIDLTHIRAGKAITPSDIQQKDIKKGDIVLLCTVIGKRRRDKKILTNYPYLSLEAAEWLIKKGVKAVGVDCISIEKHGGRKYPVHNYLLTQNISVIEGLTNLDAVKGKRILFICIPLKIKGVDGAPARAIALEFEDI